MLKIPISVVRKEDSKFWIFNGNNQYTVRSTYKALHKRKKRATNGVVEEAVVEDGIKNKLKLFI